MTSSHGTIHRYTVPVDDKYHSFSLFGNPLAVECRDPHFVEFWARHHSSGTPTPRTFTVVGTGTPLPDLLKEPNWHWGTAQFKRSNGLYGVWHLVEVWGRPT